MHRKTAFLLLCLHFLLSACGSEDRSYSADRYDVAIDVQEGGDLAVTETVVFRFEGGSYRYVFREIPTERTDGISNIQASMDGQPLPLGDDPGQVEIEEDGDDVAVTWHFAPVSDATHTFTLDYVAEGVVRQDPNADKLVWEALPTEHDYLIAASEVQVTYPEVATLSACPGVQSESTQIASGAQQATFTAQNLGEDATLCLTLAFAPGSILSAPPAWQTRTVELRPYAPLAENLALGLGGLALVILAAGVLWLSSFLYRHRQPSTTQGTEMPRLNTPPAQLPPAIVGTLNNMGAQPGWTNAAATLFDLARRGVLRLEVLPKSRWGTKDAEIHLTAQSTSELRPHERGLLDLLFEDKKGRQTSVKSSELGGRSTSHWKYFAEPLRQEMEQLGLLGAERTALRKQLQQVAIGLLLAGFVALGVTPLVFAVPALESIPVILGGVGWLALLSVGFSLLILSFVLYIASASFAPLTEAGAHAAQQAQGFQHYLKDVTKGREPFVRTDLFETYLPYAASFGMADGWAKHFQKQHNFTPSPWLQSLATAGGDDGLASIIIITSAVGGDGSSAAGGAAAAGAAGGGSSGAG